MMRLLPPQLRSSSLLIGIMAVTAMLVGCDVFNPPTASNDAEVQTDLWCPEPGDEIVPGRPVPIILDENYWEMPGMTVNPRMRGARGALTPIPINGSIGGTVTCGPSPLSFNPNAPVRLTLSYAGTQYDPDYCESQGIEPLDASQLQIWFMSQNGSLELQSIGRVFDAGSKTITVQVDHFSRYILA